MALEFDLGGVDGEQVARLMALLARSDVAECEIEQGECRLSLRRQVRQAAPSAAAPSGDGRAQEEPVPVRAPAVGLFYRSEKRPGPPKVEVGARVKVGEPLGWIEVLKVPHAVLSTHDGIVESFLVEDGQAVEYGQPVAAISY